MPVAARVRVGRVIAWGLAAGIWVDLAFTDRFFPAEDEQVTDFFSWTEAAWTFGDNALFGFVILMLVLGAPKRELLALRLPPRPVRTAGLVLAGVVAVFGVDVANEWLLDPVEEQSGEIVEWQPGRVAPFVASFVAVAVTVPIVEELFFRGVGYSLIRPFGVAAATVVTALAFTGAHGLIEALPGLLFFALVVTWLRERTGSILPPIAVHALTNAIAVTLSVLPS